jgi:hypothetical protein
VICKESKEGKDPKCFQNTLKSPEFVEMENRPSMVSVPVEILDLKAPTISRRGRPEKCWPKD